MRTKREKFQAKSEQTAKAGVSAQFSYVRPLCTTGGVNVKSGEKCFKGTYESTRD